MKIQEPQKCHLTQHEVVKLFCGVCPRLLLDPDSDKIPICVV